MRFGLLSNDPIMPRKYGRSAALHFELPDLSWVHGEEVHRRDGSTMITKRQYRTPNVR